MVSTCFREVSLIRGKDYTYLWVLSLCCLIPFGCLLTSFLSFYLCFELLFWEDNITGTFIRNFIDNLGNLFMCVHSFIHSFLSFLCVCVYVCMCTYVHVHTCAEARGQLPFYFKIDLLLKQRLAMSVQLG